MKIMYHAQGTNRKALADAISQITGARKIYKGIPNYEYEIDCFTVDREGNLNFDDRADNEKIEDLLEKLDSGGFHAELVEPTPAASSETPLEAADEQKPQEQIPTDIITKMSFPKDEFTETVLDNLQKLVASKASLIQKAFEIDSLPIELQETQISFPWLQGKLDADTVQARIRFITALCNTAKTQKRVTATEKKVENEKYAFRCFLLRLGFIGKEHAKDRKILLANLSGSAAFKGGAKHAISE